MCWPFVLAQGTAEGQTEAPFLFFSKALQNSVSIQMHAPPRRGGVSFSIAFHATVRVAACVRIFRGRHASLACLRTSATDDIRSKAAFLRQSWTCACRLQCRPPWNSELVGAEGQTARGDPTLRENNYRSPGRRKTRRQVGPSLLFRAKTPVHRGARRERGSTQLAAASKKRHQKVRLSQR